ncbi:ATP-binding protein [Vibrio sp.]|nr:ATP-binding protein [Vibrio sp.]
MWSIKRINIIFALLVALLVTVGANMVWHHSYQSLISEHQLQLERFSSHITTTIDKYSHIPKLLSKDRQLIDALYQPKNSAQIDITNRYLQEINQIVNASDTYLLDANGTTIAASNWQNDKTFLGRNFEWRPYFQQASKGESSQYFALGSTSGERGYYYSSPIVHAGSVLGVIVVKMDLSSIEEHWKNDGSYFVATDTNNIIFMSSRADWLFKSLTPINAIKMEAIKQSRRYLNRDIEPLQLTINRHITHNEWLDNRIDWMQGDYIVSNKALTNIPLIIRVVTPKISVFWSSFSYILLSLMASLILYLSILLLHSRRVRQRHMELLQAEAKQKLEFQVMERTADLHSEIIEREKTEQQLRKTQNELIQAAKLAVLGQMSSSVSHELNNPLAAIRSYAENGRRFLTKEKYERVDDNLIRISALTERIAQISTQLKSFSQRSNQQRKKCLVLPLILSVKALLQPQLKSHRVNLTLDENTPDIYLYVNPVEFEQVLVNIVTNAIQAVDEKEDKRVHIGVSTHQDECNITVDDSGPGIQADDTDKIFEPFYTTKKNGLGLGLSISMQIAESMDGTIIACSNENGGARFILTLPLLRLTKTQG